jgi:chromosome segregation ATPase
MDSVDTLQKRLQDEAATVEEKIASHNQQIEALTKRLEGLKRAIELFKSEQLAIAELLHAGGNGLLVSKTAIAPATGAKGVAAQRQADSNAQISRAKTSGAARNAAARQNGGLTRIDMIAAVLRRHPRRTVRELIALLDKECRWKTTESAVTGHLYTRRDRFVHTPPDREHNRPVTWSSK